MANEEHKINLNFQTNANQAAGAVNNLGNALDKEKKAADAANKSTKDLDKTFEEVYGDLQPLTTRMGEAEDRLYELALAGKQATAEFQALLEVTANYRATQIEVDKIVDASSATIGQKLGGAVQLASGLFQGFNSGMALFGDTSKDTQEKLLKLEAAFQFAQAITSVIEMREQWLNLTKSISFNQKEVKTTTVATQALTQATQSAGQAAETTTIATIAEGTAATFAAGAFTALKAVLASLGIGLVVAGIAALIANFDKVLNLFNGAADALTRLNAKQIDINEERRITVQYQDDTIEGLTKEIELLKAKGASEDEILVKEKELIKAKIEYNKELTDVNNEELRHIDELIKKDKDYQDLQEDLSDLETKRTDLKAKQLQADLAGRTNSSEFFGRLLKDTNEEIDLAKDKIKIYEDANEIFKKQKELQIDNRARFMANASLEKDILIDTAAFKHKLDEEEKKRLNELLKGREEYFKHLAQIEKSAREVIEDIEDTSSTDRLERAEQRELDTLQVLRDAAIKAGYINEKDKEAFDKYYSAKLEITNKYIRLLRKQQNEINEIQTEGILRRMFEDQKYNASFLIDRLDRLKAERQIEDDTFNSQLKTLQIRQAGLDETSKEYAEIGEQILNLTQKHNQFLLTNTKETTDQIFANQKQSSENLLEFAIFDFEAQLAENDRQKQIILATTYDSEALKTKALADNAAERTKIREAEYEHDKFFRDLTIDDISKTIDIFNSLFYKTKDQQKAGLIAENALGIARNIIGASESIARVNFNVETATSQALTLGPAGAPIAAAAQAAGVAMKTAIRINSALGIAASIAATAKGLEAINRGGSAGGASTTLPSASTQQPNVSFQASSANQLQQTLINTQQQPSVIKAYVTSADIANAASLEANTISKVSI